MMRSTKKEIIGNLIVVVMGILLIIIMKSKFDKDIRLGKAYMDTFKYKFSGIVEDKVLISGNDGMLYLTKVQGMKENYDPRDSLNYYCCVIKNGKAELIVGGMRLYKKGDSIYVNGEENMLYHYRNNKLIQEVKLIATPFYFLYEPAKRLHRIK